MASNSKWAYQFRKTISQICSFNVLNAITFCLYVHFIQRDNFWGLHDVTFNPGAACRCAVQSFRTFYLSSAGEMADIWVKFFCVALSGINVFRCSPPPPWPIVQVEYNVVKVGGWTKRFISSIYVQVGVQWFQSLGFGSISPDVTDTLIKKFEAVQ